MKLRFSDQYHVILGQTVHDGEIIRTNVTMEVRKMEAMVSYAVHDEACAIEGKGIDKIDAEFCTCGFITTRADLDATLEEKEKKTNGE